MGIFNEKIGFVSQNDNWGLINERKGGLTDGTTELMKGSHFSVRDVYIDCSFASNTKTTISA